MIILALDLTSAFGSIAVRAQGKLSASLDLDSQDGFAHLIFPAIQELLNRAGVRADEIDCFATATGPGAFTGVRVGLATAKGLAEAFHRPVSGISNLRALSTFGTAARRAVFIDARRGDVFGAVFNQTGELLGEEIVMPLPAWMKTLPRPLPELISNAPVEDIAIVTAPRRIAGAIALCAEMDGERGLWLDPAALDANYVRRSDAELFWTEP